MEYSKIMKSCIYVLVLLCAFANVKAKKDDNGFEYPDDWVDPGDMYSFDSVLKRNVESAGHETRLKTQKVGTEQDNTPAAQDTLSCPKCPDCSKCSDTAIQPACPKCQDCPKCEKTSLQEVGHNGIFFKRYVAVLLKKLQSVGKPPDYSTYHAQLHLTEESWELLTKFAEGSDVAVQDVAESLEDIFSAVNPGTEDWDSHLWWKFEDYFHISCRDALTIGALLFLLVVALTLQMFSRISWSTQLKRLVILAFIISFPITYIHEYQVAVAEHKSKVSSIPERCLQLEKHTTLYDDVTYFFRHHFSTQKDLCLEYHEYHLISPIIKVPPTKVLAVTLTRFFLEPLSHFGTTFSQTFRNMFSELPIQLWIPAFIFLIVIMFVLLMLFSVCFGYAWNVNLPFWSGIEIGPQRHLNAPRQMEQLMENHRQQLQVLQAAIERQNSQPGPALPAPPQPVEGPGFFGSVLGRLGLGGRSPLRSADSEPDPVPSGPRDPPYPVPLDVSAEQHFGPIANDMPATPEQSQVRRRANRLSYPPEQPGATTAPDHFMTDLAGGDGLWRDAPAQAASSAGPSRSPRPDSPPAYSEVEGPLPYPYEEPGTRRPIGFEGIYDLPATTAPEDEPDSHTEAKCVASQVSPPQAQDPLDESDFSDIEVLSRDTPDESEI